MATPVGSYEREHDVSLLKNIEHSTNRATPGVGMLAYLCAPVGVDVGHNARKTRLPVNNLGLATVPRSNNVSSEYKSALSILQQRHFRCGVAYLDASFQPMF